MKIESLTHGPVKPDSRCQNGTDAMTNRMTFANLRTDQRANAIKNTTIASQNVPRTRNRLTAMREESTATEPKKAHQECLCTHKMVDGVLWLVSSPDCPRKGHGVFHENLDFKQNPNLNGTQSRRKSARGVGALD